MSALSCHKRRSGVCRKSCTTKHGQARVLGFQYVENERETSIPHCSSNSRRAWAGVPPRSPRACGQQLLNQALHVRPHAAQWCALCHSHLSRMAASLGVQREDQSWLTASYWGSGEGRGAGVAEDLHLCIAGKEGRSEEAHPSCLGPCCSRSWS